MGRINKKKIRKPIAKKRIKRDVCPVRSTRGEAAKKAVRSIPWYLSRLDGDGKKDRVEIHALRRQVKANGRCKMVRCWLVKAKNRGGRWVIRLEGGITGREQMNAMKHAGDCFFKMRLHGWTVHKGKLGEDPRDDYFWVPGREIADALYDFGWL